MFDTTMFRLLTQPSTRFDFLVIATVMIVAQIDLIAASATGVGLAILLFIRDQARSSVVASKLDLRGIRSKRRRLTAENDLLRRDGDQAMVVQLNGNLFFGTTDQLFTELENDLNALRYLLFDLRRVQSMDFTAVHLFEQMQERLFEHGGGLLLCGMPSGLPTRSDIAGYLAQIGLIGAQGNDRIFDTQDAAIQWMEEQILDRAGWRAPDPSTPLNPDQIELFSGLPSDKIAVLTSLMTEVSFAAGQRIFAAGEKSDEMFLVRSGRTRALLRLAAETRHHVATFEAGDFFGEMAFLDRQTRSADVDAETATDLYMLSRSRFDTLLNQNPELCGEIFERLALTLSRRLRAADTELRMLERR
jgi:SulP family sulfate permease